jgi:uncharacterized damage-inducible protein DinB
MESKSSDSVRIRRQLETAFSGPAWHGPALMENLAGVSAEIAAAKLVPGAHSIWEIVNHLLAWQNEVAAGLSGKQYVTLQADADWPPVKDRSAASWDTTVKELGASHARLCEKVDALSDDQLRAKVEGKDWDLRTALRGIASHSLYHAGQIGLLKRAAH